MSIFSWLSGLDPSLQTPESRRGLIEDNVGKMIRSGLNQTQSHLEFRNLGLGIRDSDFRTIYNRRKAEIEATDLALSTVFQGQFDTDFFKQSDRDFDKHYKMIVGYTSYDPETGEWTYQETAYVTDELRSVEEELLRARYVVEEGGSPPIFSEIGHVSILRGIVNPFRE